MTRPQGQHEPLVDALENAGFGCQLAPLIEIVPITAPSARQRQILLGLCDFQHVIFISGNAIRHGMDWIEDFWPQLPVGLHWYAVGRSSARMLREFGVCVTEPRGDMNSEGLLALPSLQSLVDQRVLIVKGEGGRELLREKLAARGARVEALVVYRRVKPRYARGELGARILSTDCKFILLSSGEGLHNMVSLLDEASLKRVRGLTLIVPGVRVAKEAKAAGFSHVRIADNATDEAMVAAIVAALNESRAEQVTRIEASGGRDD